MSSTEDGEIQKILPFLTDISMFLVVFCFAGEVRPCNNHKVFFLLLGRLSVSSTNAKVHKTSNVCACAGHQKTALYFCFIVSRFEFRKTRQHFQVSDKFALSHLNVYSYLLQ